MEPPFTYYSKLGLFQVLPHLNLLTSLTVGQMILFCRRKRWKLGVGVVTYIELVRPPGLRLISDTTPRPKSLASTGSCPLPVVLGWNGGLSNSLGDGLLWSYFMFLSQRLAWLDQLIRSLAEMRKEREVFWNPGFSSRVFSKMPEMSYSSS